MPETTDSESKRTAFLVREAQMQIETLTSKMNEMISEINATQNKLKALETWKADHEKKELIQGQARFDSPGQHQHADPYREEQMRNAQQQQMMMNPGAPQMASPQMAQPQQHAMPSTVARQPEQNFSIEKVFYFGNKK